MPQPKAKRSVFAALACAAALAVGLLCLLVGRALTAPRTIRLEDYAEPVPEAFRMKADITQKDGMLSVDGYACIEGERFEHIDTFVALYPGTGGTALRLPTKMVLSEEAYVAGHWPAGRVYCAHSGTGAASGGIQRVHCLPHRRA